MQANLPFDFKEDSSFVIFLNLLKDGIKESLGEAVFYAWFKDISFYSYDGSNLFLSVKNDKIKNCIFLHYQNKFEKVVNKTFQAHFGKRLKNFEIIVKQQTLEVAKEITFSGVFNSDFNIEISLEKKFTFKNFLESDENKLAVGIAKHFAESIILNKDDVISFSKNFFVQGSIGNGKTHLIQAIAHEVKERSGAKVMYTTAERFLFNFQTAVKNNTNVDFIKQFIGVKLLIIDDIHFVATKKKTMEEIQRVCYSIISDGGFVLFASSGMPSSLIVENEKVKNFLCSSYIIKLPNPTEEFRYKLLKFKLASSNYKVSDSMLKTLAFKIHSSVRELEGSLARMVLHSQILNYEVDSQSTKFITTDIFPHKELRKFSITEVQTKVCSFFGITIEDMQSKKRVRSILKARQIAIYLASKLTTCSFIEIGKYFNRTHSTVIHSIKIIEREMTESKNFAVDVERMRFKIEEAITN